MRAVRQASTGFSERNRTLNKIQTILYGKTFTNSICACYYGPYTSACPRCEAIHKAVLPSRVAWSFLAPFSQRSRTASTCPLYDAAHKAVPPSSHVFLSTVVRDSPSVLYGNFLISPPPSSLPFLGTAAPAVAPPGPPRFSSVLGSRAPCCAR